MINFLKKIIQKEIDKKLNEKFVVRLDSGRDDFKYFKAQLVSELEIYKDYAPMLSNSEVAAIKLHAVENLRLDSGGILRFDKYFPCGNYLNFYYFDKDFLVTGNDVCFFSLSKAEIEELKHYYLRCVLKGEIK